MSERYLSINSFLKQKYGKKFIKLSIDGGFTCPNRDGTLDSEGCLFCSERGSGDYAGVISPNSEKVQASIRAQIEAQKELMRQKWAARHYIAYFQSFTNTYDSPIRLKSRYDSALAEPEVQGLAIATRADCLDDNTIEMLKTYRRLPVFWVEIGVQTTKYESRERLNLHQSLSVIESRVKALKEAEIPVVLHVIAGLPGETKADFMATITFINRLAPFGIKMHMLNVLKGTALARAYETAPFELLSRDAYIDFIVEALAHLRPDITIHRLTGDGPRELLIGPTWIRDKRVVLNGIEKQLRERSIVQGCLWHAL
ncbi:TIGR01212 family radical SAM protein [Fusibacter paucivorans]|uniref:TIGR01212 family radical SAM protein n=1 Tax=Fusibacter paucivorans TaxID=76009 RepID=A0ABS5PKL1_9FIRM|nr:TIGR01212 family radical SAM protein [Fusibacter paucivorans]MBS7525713.1 TIGR01212 family radical SAM protein [Fusibacter paucivorans]